MRYNLLKIEHERTPRITTVIISNRNYKMIIDETGMNCNGKIYNNYK